MNNVGHAWRPLEGLDHRSLEIDFRDIDSLHQRWLSYRHKRERTDPDAYKAFLERVYRSWAIETGIIEGIYSIDQGMTQTLVEKGLVADLIDRRLTDRDPDELIRILKDHQASAEFVTDSIRLSTPLSSFYIRELHQSLLRHQRTYIAYDQWGNQFETPLDVGGFKNQPNNPTRRDEKIHEYCPPIQVESEIDRLADLYEGYQQECEGYHQLLVAAWLHHRFTQIHPFQDGNGRVARALLTWHMAKENYLPIVVSREDRTQYIEALEHADAGNLIPFVRLIVRLEQEVILDALDEPARVTDTRMVSQVLESITDRVKDRRRQELSQMQSQRRSLRALASSLRVAAFEIIELRAEEISQGLNEAGLAVAWSTDWGEPGNKEHWYRAQIVQTAKHWANLNEDKFFVKLSINPQDQSETPRLVFVISLHHVGRQFTGVMAATAFAQIISSRYDDTDDTEEPNDPDLKNCTVDAFTFTSEENASAVAARFARWIEEPLSVALRHWGEFVS